MQTFTNAYKELCLVIEAKVTEIKHIDLWYDQLNYPKEEYPYPDNCLFIDFNVNSIETLGGNVQALNCTVDFIHVFDTLSDSYHGSTNQPIAFEFMATQNKLHAALQALSGVSFSSLNRVSNRRVPTQEGYLIVRSNGYNCILMDYAAAPTFGTHTITSIGVNEQTKPLVIDNDAYSGIPTT